MTIPGALRMIHTQEKKNLVHNLLINDARAHMSLLLFINFDI